MTNTNFNWARLAGLSYLGVAVLAGFAEFSARAGMVVSGDAAATFANIATDQATYALAGIADLLVLILDAVLGLALWVLLKPVNRPLALLALVLNLLRLPWMGVNVGLHFGVLLVVNGGLGSFSTEQVQDIVQFMANLHAYNYTANGIFFGAWCFVVGLLFVKSDFMPKLIGIAMMAALAGYWTDLFLVFVLPEFEAAISPVGLTVSTLAELSTVLWLSIMGGRVHRKFLNSTAPLHGAAA